jgi:hypothetical protein
MADEVRSSLAQLAAKHGGKPCQDTQGRVLSGCWRFLRNADCRRWAEEAEQWGYEVFVSLDIGGLVESRKSA